jgi:hypothetical protein
VFQGKLAHLFTGTLSLVEAGGGLLDVGLIKHDEISTGD